MKRTAENQITKDSADDDIEEIEQTGFKKASEEEISTRKIRGLPKRRGMGSESSTPGEGQTSPQKPTFNGFQGFGASNSASTTTTSTPEPPAPKPSFAAFSGFGAPAAAPAAPSATPQSLFGFGAPASTTSTAATGSSKTSQLFGASIAAADKSLSQTTQAKPPATGFSFGSTLSSASTSTKLAAPPLEKNGTSSKYDVEYYMALRGLNHSVLTALESAIAKDPFADLPLDVISKAYSKHRKDIEDSASKRAGSSNASTPSTTSSSAPAAAPALAFTLPKPPSGNFFGISKPAAAPATTEELKANSTTPTPLVFNAFKKPETGSTDTSDKASVPITKLPFSFGGPSTTTTAPSSNPFALPTTKTEDTKPFGSSFGGGNLFGTKPLDIKIEDKKTGVSSKPSLYPEVPQTTATPPAPASTTPSFFSFGANASKSPFGTPPATTAPKDAKPPAPLFSFGTGPSNSRSPFSFGAASTSATSTPGGGSLGNPVGFSFGSPPKDTISAGTATPSSSTIAGLEAAAAAARPTVAPASTAASIDGSHDPSGANTPAAEDAPPPKTEPEDVVGEGEENEDTLITARAKAYRFKDGSWTDLGTGFIKVKSDKVTESKRVLMRSDAGGRVLLNFRTHSGMKPEIMSKPTNLTLNGHLDGQPVALMLRTKTPDATKELFDTLKSLV